MSLLARRQHPRRGLFKFDLMWIESGLLTEITTFDVKLFPAFGLVPVLSADP
jgi:hypothetical protein